MKFHSFEILLMSGVPVRVREYCRQLVREQDQGAKCCSALGCCSACRVTRLRSNARGNALVAMGLEREYAQEGRGVRRPERQTGHEDVPKLVAGTSAVSAGKPDCINIGMSGGSWARNTIESTRVGSTKQASKE